MENFPILKREKVTQIQEAQRVPMKVNPKRPVPRHIIIKMEKFKHKERILKATREKLEVIYKGAPTRLATLNGNPPSQKGMARNIPRMKNKGLQPRQLYPARLSIKIEGQIRSFPDKEGSKNTPPPNQLCKIR